MGFDSIHYPLTVFETDKDLLKFLGKVRMRAELWNETFLTIGYQEGSEVRMNGDRAVLHEDPLLEVHEGETTISRIDCLVRVRNLKHWIKKAKKRASASSRTLALGLIYVEVHKRHPKEAKSKKASA